MVEISAITGDNGRLSLNADKNCIGIAAKETLRLMGQAACGVSLTLEKVRCGSGAMGGGALQSAIKLQQVSTVKAR